MCLSCRTLSRHASCPSVPFYLSRPFPFLSTPFLLSSLPFPLFVLLSCFVSPALDSLPLSRRKRTESPLTISFPSLELPACPSPRLSLFPSLCSSLSFPLFSVSLSLFSSCLFLFSLLSSLLSLLFPQALFFRFSFLPSDNDAPQTGNSEDQRMERRRRGVIQSKNWQRTEEESYSINDLKRRRTSTHQQIIKKSINPHHRPRRARGRGERCTCVKFRGRVDFAKSATTPRFLHHDSRLAALAESQGIVVSPWSRIVVQTPTHPPKNILKTHTNTPPAPQAPLHELKFGPFSNLSN